MPVSAPSPEAPVPCVDSGRKRHAQNVANLALQLFDQLQPIHHMGGTERLWLMIAALMHDIGKSTDRPTHHKIARDRIIASKDLPFGKQQRILIGLVARYHRGPLPDPSHKYYGDLDREAQRYVCKLAALLRIADGLDKSGNQTIHNLTIRLSGDDLTLGFHARQSEIIHKARNKSDLFEKVFSLPLRIDANPRQHMAVSEPGTGFHFGA